MWERVNYYRDVTHKKKHILFQRLILEPLDPLMMALSAAMHLKDLSVKFKVVLCYVLKLSLSLSAAGSEHRFYRGREKR